MVRATVAAERVAAPRAGLMAGVVREAAAAGAVVEARAVVEVDTVGAEKVLAVVALEILLQTLCTLCQTCQKGEQQNGKKNTLVVVVVMVVAAALLQVMAELKQVVQLHQPRTR